MINLKFKAKLNIEVHGHQEEKLNLLIKDLETKVSDEILQLCANNNISTPNDSLTIKTTVKKK